MHIFISVTCENKKKDISIYVGWLLRFSPCAREYFVAADSKVRKVNKVIEYGGSFLYARFENVDIPYFFGYKTEFFPSKTIQKF